jgi:molybdopterin converting factor small subunit
MPTVIFSAAQRRFTAGDERVELEASRVDELIRALEARYPALDGQLEHAAVSVDGVVHNDALYVALPAGAEIHFVGAIAGGSGDAVGEPTTAQAGDPLGEPTTAQAGDPLGEPTTAQAGDPLGLALGWRRAGRAVAIATVVETWGSSPCPAGSQLAVDGEGHFEGSVSGGCVEGAVIEGAGEVISTGEPVLLEFGVANEEAWAVGLACGGRVRIYVERLD